MTLYSRPIVNACYLGRNSEMFKVRFLSYFGEQIKEVVVEDIRGNVNTVDIDSWQNQKLIPFCYSGNDINQLKLG